MTDLELAPSFVLEAGEGDRVSFQGAEVIFKSPASGSDGWTVVDYTIPARRFGAPLHYHEELVETFYCGSD